MITANPVTITVFCDDCGRGLTVLVRDIARVSQTRCETCGALGWHSADQPNGRYPYALSYNDRRLLRALYIEPTE